MTVVLLIVLILLLLFLRQNIILVIAVATAFVHLVLVDSKLEFYFQDIWQSIDREILLPIPLFMLAGAIMTKGSIAERLIRVMVVLTAPIRGGLGVAAILSCAAFAAISGSSTVTMLAVGAIMYPALIKEGYNRRFALGALCSAGTLGIIIPPSIPLILYGVVTETNIINLFIAGVLPGLLLTGMMSGYAFWVNRELPSSRWDLCEIAEALRKGVFSLMLPVILLGGIYSGYFTATESAVVAVGYALVVELFIHREMKPKDTITITLETAKLLGTLLPLLAIAGSLNAILEFASVPEQMVEAVTGTIKNKWLMLAAINFILLIIGCFMEVISALLILSNILLPLAESQGIDPVHFGIIMIVNLEIGFLTPPVGLNILVAMVAFREPFGVLVRSILPFLAIMILALIIITTVPWLSMALIR
jgi:C4-dicarboxylate transporter DctM subunit